MVKALPGVDSGLLDVIQAYIAAKGHAVGSQSRAVAEGPTGMEMDAPPDGQGDAKRTAADPSGHEPKRLRTEEGVPSADVRAAAEQAEALAKAAAAADVAAKARPQGDE